MQNQDYYFTQKCKNTLQFLCSALYHQLSNRFLKIFFHFDYCFYCVDSNGESFESCIGMKIEEKIAELKNKNIDILKIPKNELVNYFIAQKRYNKAEVVKKIDDNEIECIKFCDFLDLTYEQQYILDLSELAKCKIVSYEGGFFVYYASPKGATLNEVTIPPEFDKVNFFHNWAIKNHCDSLISLNKIILDGNLTHLNSECEKLDNSEIEKIVDELISQLNNRRIIAISGSSSSGKSTFSLHLKSAIEKRNLQCEIIPMDTYFMNRDERPRDENGNIDFESIHIVHTKLLGDRIDKLINGESIPERRYKYVEGVGGDLESSITLDSNGFLIVEGLHALNPFFLNELKSSKILKIYISPLIPLSIDGEKCFDPYDLFLLRRIMRDFNERMYSPQRNIEWWPNVCQGKEKYIFPFLKSADFFGTCQLAYEINAMSCILVPLLEKSLSVNNHSLSNEILQEIRRLLFSIKRFNYIETEMIPNLYMKKSFSSILYKVMNMPYCSLLFFSFFFLSLIRDNL
ncbi:Phosphoribulokinase [Tritrichomonas foetus]|uniref:Phosphoribulokinase n=1 Tax=Tritrichomonas foetus TaxID=1144522 RepID=A0A1J4JGS8_9EUKA|nr:Phosphoribulokinase [Tritrichomonas foetus]|eukprot:OHS96661.1 Phosphoribulokinase [Tritrichomonas foetus]